MTQLVIDYLIAIPKDLILLICISAQKTKMADFKVINLLMIAIWLTLKGLSRNRTPRISLKIKPGRVFRRARSFVIYGGFLRIINYQRGNRVGDFLARKKNLEFPLTTRTRIDSNN